MEELVTVLSLWIAGVTGIPEAPVPPRIRMLEPSHIGAMHLGRYDAPGAEDVVAVYFSPLQTIVLPSSWNMHDPVDVSALVHELVHHAQHHAGLDYPCPEAREAVAYDAQAAWLQMFGEDLESAFGIDPMTLMLRTKCFY